MAVLAVSITVEHQYPFRGRRRRMRFLKNRAQTDIVESDREFMLLGKAFDLLLPFSQAHAPRPNPRELRIVNGANFLSLQFRFNQIDKLAHQGIASFGVRLFHFNSNRSYLRFETSEAASPGDKLRRRKEWAYSVIRSLPLIAGASDNFQTAGRRGGDLK
jgi:hypothetical protein